MKRLLIILTIYFYTHPASIAQEVSLDKFYLYRDTIKSYYLSTCEEFNALFKNSFRYYDGKPDSCFVDFSKYDLSGSKVGDSIIWRLVTPKKFLEWNFQSLIAFEKMKWKFLPQSISIEDSFAFNGLRKYTHETLEDTFNFNKIALMYNDIWLDCHGTYYYKILYDPVQNKIICNIVEVYGGCRGMGPGYDSWIMVYKPKPDTRIEVKTLQLN